MGPAINRDVKAVPDAASPVLEARRLVERLDPLETRFLALVCEGCSLVRASADLSLSLEATALLKATVMRKLGATRTADLVRVGLYAQPDEN